MPNLTPKTAQDIYADAMKLSEDEREILRAMLDSESGHGWPSPEIEQAWMAEIESREQLFREGKNPNLSLEEAREQVLQHLDALHK